MRAMLAQSDLSSSNFNVAETPIMFAIRMFKKSRNPNRLVAFCWVVLFSINRVRTIRTAIYCSISIMIFAAVHEARGWLLIRPNRRVLQTKENELRNSQLDAFTSNGDYGRSVLEKEPFASRKRQNSELLDRALDLSSIATYFSSLLLVAHSLFRTRAPKDFLSNALCTRAP